MCGVVGIYGKRPVSRRLYDALTWLQHRGQDAAGIVSCEGRSVHGRRGMGYVRDVFSEADLAGLRGNIGIGHVRYPTSGVLNLKETQPFYVNSPYGIAIAHNGNLINSATLRDELFRDDLRNIDTLCDSEVLLNVFAHEMLAKREYPITPDAIFEAVSRVHRRCHGAYAAVFLLVGQGLLFFRDPNGIRPLIYGKRDGKHGVEYMVASESVALVSQGFTIERDVRPGEAVFISKDEVHARDCSPHSRYRSCLFEYVYLARPDSIVDDVFVHKARMRMGERLAAKILRELPANDIDVVIPVPDTSRTAALELAVSMDVRYREGFIKNRFIGRTFIMSAQALRQKSVRLKLNPLGIEFKDKNVLLVDDSIVRGTTSRQIVRMAREAGAKKVYFASAAPPVCFPNVYGIDMPSRQELLAAEKNTEEIEKILGADRVFYQDLDDLVASVRAGNSKLEQFDASVFDGNYLHDVSDSYWQSQNNVREGRRGMILAMAKNSGCA